MPNLGHTLFISDLHLSPHSPALNQHFFYFLKHIAAGSDALYILGDFFELWLGNDIKNELYDNIVLNLKNLKAQGTKIFFMKGNRDFLLSQNDVAAMNMTLINDPTLITLYGKKFLLTHGDRLCTLDHAYQRYRRMANIKLLQWIFLHTPQGFRQNLANKVHDKNPHKNEAQNLNYTLADATDAAIVKDIAKYQPDYIIHGHTHRMGLHWLNDKVRIVLGDWQKDYFNYLFVSAEEVLLESCGVFPSSLAYDVGT